MNSIRRLYLGPALSFVLLAGRLFAQSPENTPANNEKQPDTSSSEVIGSASTDSVAPTEYVPALDGSGLIALDSVQRFHFLFGGSVSGGWDSNPGNLTVGSSSGVYSVSPYVGVQASTDNTQYILQYQPTVTHYSGYSGETMQMASAKILGHLSPRWNWTMGVTGSHGQDSVRLLAPTQAVAIGDVPGTGPNSGSYLPDAGTVTNVDGSFGLHYDKSPRDGIDIRAGNTFSSISSLHASNSVATGNFNYTHALSPTLSVVGYGQGAQYYAGLRCSTFGGGGGIQWQPRMGMYVFAKGGPQIDTSDCKSQQGFAYSVSFATQLTAKSQIYVLSERQAVSGYLGPGLWQDSVSGGYSRTLGTHDRLAFDAGYVTSSTLQSISSYRGAYVNSYYSHFLRNGLAAVLSYRGYVGSTGGADFGRNVVLVSLNWTPNSRQPVH